MECLFFSGIPLEVSEKTPSSVHRSLVSLSVLCLFVVSACVYVFVPCIFSNLISTLKTILSSDDHGSSRCISVVSFALETSALVSFFSAHGDSGERSPEQVRGTMHRVVASGHRPVCSFFSTLTSVPSTDNVEFGRNTMCHFLSSFFRSLTRGLPVA